MKIFQKEKKKFKEVSTFFLEVNPEVIKPISAHK